jgi:lysophospholipase L1-like esterase
MNKAGCPPPIVSVFSNPPTRVGPPPPNGCALRETQVVPPPYLNNVAVPGAYAYSILDNLNAALAHPNALTTFFLGGYTQTGMLKKVDPTFVTVWIGYNDVLTAATAGGDTTLITDTLAFKASYRAMLDSIATTSARGGVLIGVANVTLIPFFSKGSIYWAIKNGFVPGAAFPPTFAVSNTCASMTNVPGAIGDSVLVPFTFGIPLIAAAQAGVQDTLKCTETQTVQPAELRKLAGTVISYNSFITAQAAAHGFAYFDPNTLFTALPTGSIPAFPTISGAGAVSAPFGSYFSRDGVHPTALSHKLLANALIALINATYNKSLGTIP